jgi:hypothetical protein
MRRTVITALAAVAATAALLSGCIRRPLSHRSLVDGSSGARIPYLGGGRLPRLSYLPPGYRYAVGTIAAFEGQQPLPASQLARIVDGLRPGTAPASAR